MWVALVATRHFDWEVEPAALVAEPVLQVNSPTYSAGAGRSTTRWACSSGKSVTCPWCYEDVTALPSKAKCERKKVSLAVLLCPSCQTVWQWRGELPEQVSCPVCRKEYNPLIANVPAEGKFLCSCGQRDDIIRSVRLLAEDRLLPIHPYGIEGYCALCAGGDENSENAEHNKNSLFATTLSATTRAEPAHNCRISKNGGKFFKGVTPADLHRIEEAVVVWERKKIISRTPGRRFLLARKRKPICWGITTSTGTRCSIRGSCSASPRSWNVFGPNQTSGPVTFCCVRSLAP